MKVSVIGTGYVGLVTGTCLAESGNDVICMDIDQQKITMLRAGADKVVNHKELIIPGYVSVLSGSLEEKLGGGWKVVVGPREANQLPAFLKQKVAA